jgi:hypothetical protein
VVRKPRADKNGGAVREQTVLGLRARCRARFVPDRHVGTSPVAGLQQPRVRRAQGIEYFTYWTTKSAEWDFHEGPIAVDGKRTPVYDCVKRVNEEIRGLSGVFFGAKVSQVAHTGVLPTGTHAYEAATPVLSLKTEGNGAIVSLLEKGRRRFLAIVNRDFHAAMPLALTFDSSTEVNEVQKDGSTRKIAERDYSKPLEPGDILVLTWRSAD